MSSTTNIDVPEKFKTVFLPNTPDEYSASGKLIRKGHKRARYFVRYGGRAAGKSHAYALAVVLRMYTEPTRVLCARETMKSLSDSVHRLLEDKIDALNLRGYFDITENQITCKHNGSSAIFKGLGINVNDAVRSLERINLVWIEEADQVSRNSWEVLIPTIVRNEGAEFFIGFNVGTIEEETYKRFVLNFDPERMDVELVTYLDNPFLTAAVREEAEALKKTDLDAYLHIWMGEPISQKAGGVFKVANIKRVTSLPVGCRWVRGWDLAASAIQKNKTPDFTVGTLLGFNPETERYIVADVKRIQGAPDDVEKLLLDTATSDGIEVEQAIPTDPGQAGKFQSAYLAKKLSGFRIHSEIESGNKVTRAEPVSSQANVGNIDVMEAPWTDAFLNELESFCGDPKLKDDQVDSLSTAFKRLATPRYMSRLRIF